MSLQHGILQAVTYDRGGIFKGGGGGGVGVVLFYNFWRRLWRREFNIKIIENLPKIAVACA